MTESGIHTAIVIARFMKKFRCDRKTGCWFWTACVTKGGYGQFWDGRRVRGAHCVAYEIFKGPIPRGLEPDHLCRVRRCVNPDHLEAVTRRVNLLRGKTITARKVAQTHCHIGHLLSGTNLYIQRNGTRACRICRATNYRRWVAANRERRREIDRQNYARRAEEQR